MIYGKRQVERLGRDNAAYPLCETGFDYAIGSVRLTNNVTVTLPTSCPATGCDVGDPCTQASDCATNACDTSDLYGCENRCVAEHRIKNYPQTNCPVELTFDAPFTERPRDLAPAPWRPVTSTTAARPQARADGSVLQQCDRVRHQCWRAGRHLRRTGLCIGRWGSDGVAGA